MAGLMEETPEFQALVLHLRDLAGRITSLLEGDIQEVSLDGAHFYAQEIVRWTELSGRYKSSGADGFCLAFWAEQAKIDDEYRRGLLNHHLIRGEATEAVTAAHRLVAHLEHLVSQLGEAPPPVEVASDEGIISGTPDEFLPEYRWTPPVFPRPLRRT